MKIEFADARPTGEYALVLPSAGTNRPGAASLGDAAKVEATLRSQRFEGEAASSAELFADDGGTAAADPVRRHRRRLDRQGSGRKARRGSGRKAAQVGREACGDRPCRARLRCRFRGARRACRGAPLVALRPLSHADQGQAQADPGEGDHRRRRRRGGRALDQPLAAGRRRASPSPAAWSPSRPTSSTRKASSSCAGRSKSSASASRCSTASRWPTSAWALCSASPRARSATRGCWCCAGTAARKAPRRPLSSARA